MRGTKDSYYWDTCLFVSWLADEQRPSGEMDGVREVISRVKKRDASLVTSALTLAEVLPSKYPTGVYNLFDDLLKRTTIRVVSVDRKIAKMAGDLRAHYEKEGKNLTTPDAIHLATAIINGVTEFHTFDNGKKKGLGLLSLNGNVGGHKLVICKPTFKQPSLDLVVDNDKNQNAKKSG
jgi:predicted nucleic acid-binding protein